MSRTQNLCLVTAVYNDWAALLQLLADIERTFADKGIAFDVLVVNDGSTTAVEPEVENYRTGGVIRSISLLELRANVGNQFALATGLRYAADHFDEDAMLVMDADGEDTVADAVRLIEAWRAKPNTIIVGQRTKRSESIAFRLFYALYRVVFRLLTGQNISFGNFSVIPRSLLRNITSRPELLHHYSATILRTRLPLTQIATTRGKRYAGQSHMSMPPLVFHAVAGFSVFSDILFSRLLIAAASVGAICAVGIVAVSALRLLTDVAFPNWATTVISFLVLLATQAILLILCSGFLLLTGRSSMLMTSLDPSRIHLPPREIGTPGSNNNIRL
jgi:glycosyltransferase involved in cell wall biosynthesis